MWRHTTPPEETAEWEICVHSSRMSVADCDEMLLRRNHDVLYKLYKFWVVQLRGCWVAWVKFVHFPNGIRRCRLTHVATPLSWYNFMCIFLSSINFGWIKSFDIIIRNHFVNAYKMVFGTRCTQLRNRGHILVDFYWWDQGVQPPSLPLPLPLSFPYPSDPFPSLLPPSPPFLPTPFPSH